MESKKLKWHGGGSVKIAFVINSLQGGGAERALARATMELPQEWEIDIILSDSSNIAYEYRGNIIDLKIPKRKTILYYVKSFLKRYFVLRKLKRQRKYNVCIGFSESASIVNIISGNKYCKTITSVRTVLSQAGRRKEYRYIVSPLVKLLYRKSDMIIAVSESVRLDLIRNYGIDEMKVRTIYNGYDFENIDAQINMPLSDEGMESFRDNIKIVTMGRYSLPKAQWHLIRAFAEVLRKLPDVRLVILGNGELEKYLKKLVKELNIADKVLFSGFQKNPFNILSQCQVFVFPSRYEGFSNALVEAMYCGLPIIAADYDGVREILAPDMDRNKAVHEVEYAAYGILTPVCDGIQYQAEDELTEEERILARAMIAMLQSKDLQREYAQRAKARSKVYDSKLFGKQWAAVISE